ncbi:hypothetical protein ScPMuIL_001581 [Solemya velum]
MASLAAPKAISPAIRFGRYAALLTGMLYGYTRLGSLTAKEKVIQEHENKIKAARAIQQAEDRARKTNVEMQSLAGEMGIKPAV